MGTGGAGERCVLFVSRSAVLCSYLLYHSEAREWTYGGAWGQGANRCACKKKKNGLWRPQVIFEGLYLNTLKYYSYNLVLLNTCRVHGGFGCLVFFLFPPL